ncbi:TP53-regulating kinase [Zancudomyces culisetae]|uniref:non-specific serine/threonine protein kinase n=1 Tax=Zancudomyces culisetae TaxID=1213189 RepID=A0A1R1PKF1_ZANCU|nr:TP53-regulating kinase [Zancudomyces culisetae]|eukprot:OMH81434.1 TP53-regulating kinase [Zancudomyces culisetae]
MTQELRLIHRCKLANINVPAIYHVDKVNNTIYYEYISDLNAKRYLDDNLSNKEIESELAAKAAETLAKLHDLGVVHGDLTTSNMLLVHKNNETPRDMELYLIDFGLGFVSSLPEDKAVDLYVFERALASTYPNCEQFLEKFYDSYTRLSKHSKTTLRRLADVRLRGRKRDMTG